MKKTILILLSICVLACGLWYRAGRQQEKNETLFWAAYDGDLTAVKNALENGAQLHTTLYINDPIRRYNMAQFTPLFAAASGGNPKLLDYLLEQGEALEQTNEQGWTALFIAVRDGHAETAARLVARGASVNPQTDVGTTPLIMSLIAPFDQETDRTSLLEYLLKREADPNLATILGTDALFYAVTLRQEPALIELLLQYQADPCRTYAGETLLQLAEKTPKKEALLHVLKQACKQCPNKK